MSEFRHFWNFVQKPQRDQISELRKWSDSFSLGPALSQTKPSPAVSVQSVSSVANVRDEAETTAEVNNFGEESKVDEDVFASSEVEELFVEREYDDEVFASSEEDQQLAIQIAEKEEQLLEIWEHGPAQITLSHEMRISYLEEKLEKAHEDNKHLEADNKYLEALLEVRDADFARYQDLERKQRRLAINLEDEVDILHAELDEKDRSLRLALKKVDMIRTADTVSMELSKAQMQLAKSTLALVAKNKKTKLVTAQSVRYCTTKPREEVKREMIEAEQRERETRRNTQKVEIDVMVSAVDRIAASYDRYENVSTVITFSEPRSDTVVPDHLFKWVDKDMIALWLFTVEPTAEEQEKYDRHLNQQLRPDPIYSPNLPKPRVNWGRLNPNMKRNLPQPVSVPVQGCCQVVEFYSEQGMLSASGLSYSKFDTISGYPFGALLGFQTSMGVLAPPEEHVHGYHFSQETGTWIIAAEGG